jgi:PAS domain S-box-containing protein
MASRIFIVEDEPVIAASIRRRLEQVGYEIAGAATSGEAAIRQVDEQLPDLVLMDVKLEGPMDGVDAAANIQSRLDIPVVFLTAFADEATIQRAREKHPFGYIVKPFTDRELASAIEIALERSALEQRLRESETRYRMLSEVIADYAFCIQPSHDQADDTLVWEVGSLASVTGEETGPFTQPSGIAHLLHPDHLPLLEQYWSELRKGNGGQIELRLISGTGERWAKLDAKPGKLESGARVIYGVFQDITRLRRTQDELAQTRFEFSQIVQRLRQSIWVSDADGVCIYVNQAFVTISGYPSEALIGQERLENLLLDGAKVETEPYEASLKRRDGGQTPVLVTPRFIEGDRGAERGAFFLIVDISQQKRTQRLLERGARKLQGVFHLSPVPSILIDSATNAIVDVNDAFTRELGYAAGEIVGTGGFGLADYSNLEDLNHMMALLRERSESRSTIRLRSSQGESRVFTVDVRDVVVEGEELLMLLLEAQPR